MTEQLIEMKEIEKTYVVGEEKVRALRGVTFAIVLIPELICVWDAGRAIGTPARKRARRGPRRSVRAALYQEDGE